MQLDPLLESIERALTNRNWHAALALALILPDICGKAQYPGEVSGRKRYARWFDEFVAPRYRRKVGPLDNVSFLEGDDCYDLRCAYLHEGRGDPTQSRRRGRFSQFEFTAPREGVRLHMNIVGNKLQLQVDVFCEDICFGVRFWEDNFLSKDTEIQRRLRHILVVNDLEKNFRI